MRDVWAGVIERAERDETQITGCQRAMAAKAAPPRHGPAPSEPAGPGARSSATSCRSKSSTQVNERKGQAMPELAYHTVPGRYGAETRCTDVEACKARQAEQVTV